LDLGDLCVPVVTDAAGRVHFVLLIFVFEVIIAIECIFYVFMDPITHGHVCAVASMVDVEWTILGKQCIRERIDQ